MARFKYFRFLLLIISFVCSNIIYAQNISFKEFKGLVKSNSSKKNLSLANILISNTNISTVTNSEGEFSIKVPANALNNNIIINHLGYKPLKIPISSLSPKANIFKLHESVTSLNSITINKFKNAKALVEKTLKLKGDNYIDKNSIMTGFYRETIKKRRKNASLSEAVVTINKQPYRSTKKDQVAIIKARKKSNYRRLDTLALKLQGGPFNCLFTDLIKYPQFVFNQTNLNNYDFSYGPSTQINNKTVFVVNFKQKPHITLPLYYGKLYIDTENFALTSAIYNLNVSDKKQSSKIFIRRKPKNVKVYPTHAGYRVNYKTMNGKWYFAYSNIALTFKVNWKNKLFNSKYTLQSEMAITDWIFNKSEKGLKNKIHPRIIMTDEASGFSDPEFWGKYNIIEPEKSIESAIKKIKKQLGSA